MQTRFKPSLETLGDRLTPSTVWDPTTSQTRQITIVQDLAPPGPDLNVSAGQTTIPSVTDLVIDSFDGRGAAPEGTVPGRITGVAADPSLEGHECLVFYLGGIPSPGPPQTEYVFGVELPAEATRHVRHRLFAIVDRTQLGPFFEFTGKRLEPSEADGGRKYKMLFAPLLLELDNAQASPDASPGVSVLLRRLANPSIPDEGARLLYQDVFTPSAAPIALARASGM